MDLSSDATRKEWTEHLGELFRDRLVVCGIAPLAGYTDLVGLLEQSGARATLGRDGIPIVTLTHTPDLPPADRHAAGLYHTAVAFPDRAALAATVLSMAQRAADLYQGATDHTFSNAFYFSDPEGNGIELY